MPLCGMSSNRMEQASLPPWGSTIAFNYSPCALAQLQANGETLQARVNGFGMHRFTSIWHESLKGFFLFVCFDLKKFKFFDKCYSLELSKEEKDVSTLNKCRQSVCHLWPWNVNNLSLTRSLWLWPHAFIAHVCYHLHEKCKDIKIWY